MKYHSIAFLMANKACLIFIFSSSTPAIAISNKLF